jgi:CRISPR system Cascade subunit CasE
MIASLYRLSRRDIAELRVRDDYSIHRIVYDLFPESGASSDGSRDFLYADKGGDTFGRLILILSRRPPREPRAGSVESREVPETFLQHDRYAFEVVLNPSRRDSKSSKTVAIRSMDELRAWFLGKSAGWGFAPQPERLAVSRIGVQSFEHKDEGRVIHGSATYSGILAVGDRHRFRESFECGIGRCRGFGFGLLQLRPVDRTGGAKY